MTYKAFIYFEKLINGELTSLQLTSRELTSQELTSREFSTPQKKTHPILPGCVFALFKNRFLEFQHFR